MKVLFVALLFFGALAFAAAEQTEAVTVDAESVFDELETAEVMESQAEAEEDEEVDAEAALEAEEEEEAAQEESEEEAEETEELLATSEEESEEETEESEEAEEEEEEEEAFVQVSEEAGYESRAERSEKRRLASINEALEGNALRLKRNRKELTKLMERKLAVGKERSSVIAGLQARVDELKDRLAKVKTAHKITEKQRAANDQKDVLRLRQVNSRIGVLVAERDNLKIEIAKTEAEIAKAKRIAKANAEKAAAAAKKRAAEKKAAEEKRKLELTKKLAAKQAKQQRLDNKRAEINKITAEKKREAVKQKLALKRKALQKEILKIQAELTAIH